MSFGNSSAGEKTEKPTPKRLQDARKQGTVAKSNDLVGALVLLAIAGTAPALFNQFGADSISAFKVATANPKSASSFDIIRNLATLVIPGATMLGVLMAVAMGVGLAANFAQVGFHLSGEALSPKLSKLNPTQGITRLLSRRTVFEAAKTFAKFCIVSYIAYTAINQNWPTLVFLMTTSPANAAQRSGAIISLVALRVGVAWLVLGAIDYFFQRQQMMKQLMMTKDELKREYKEAEGSPEIKAARMQRMRKLSKNRMAQAVQQADAIITNPTHFAVAIKYDREKMHAPMVVAKGVDYLALKIREIAEDAKVPIVPNPPLARALYKQCEVGDFIPRDLFENVAEVLAYVYKSIKGIKPS